MPQGAIIGDAYTLAAGFGGVRLAAAGGGPEQGKGRMSKPRSGCPILLLALLVCGFARRTGWGDVLVTSLGNECEGRVAEKEAAYEVTLTGGERMVFPTQAIRSVIQDAGEAGGRDAQLAVHVATGYDGGGVRPTFSADGRTLATATRGGSIALWDVASQRQLQMHRGEHQ